ncbi:TlpA disulfide reductase family protein [Nitratiruptor sp. YY09-18]|uniref:TlpA family protein disulfide reductase n=1 Tax=Nitratiruptor sp. YY09-18 TaxID=2724901 RepID=UPI0019168514|nr:TlpA disulfide reductase family protein [Nitratiruptor sp. YY09-18]BCD68256.1 hypothetical protein NitYY0918_C1167 [Nitratiruptor sp. YY09-18]
MKIFIPFLLAIFIITGCQKKEHEEHTKTQQAKQESVQKPKPKPLRSTFTLRDTNSTIALKIKNNAIKIPNSKKVVALLFFTTWCPSCKAEIPELEAAAKKFKNMQIIGILLDHTNDIDKFKKDEKIDFFVSTNIKENQELAKRLYPMVQAPATMPIPLTIIFVDGKYFVHYLGAAPYEMIVADMQRVEGE